MTFVVASVQLAFRLNNCLSNEPSISLIPVQQ
jgi:hypothetical protein